MSRPRPRVFLDSNVIFSGLYSPRGAPGMILEHFIQGHLSVVVSPQVLEEVIRTIKEKLPQALLTVKKLLVSLPPEVVRDPKLEEIGRWSGELSAADAAILAAAVSAQPDYFITGDSHFMPPSLAEKSGLHIVTPGEFLKLLEHLET